MYIASEHLIGKHRAQSSLFCRVTRVFIMALPTDRVSNALQSKNVISKFEVTEVIKNIHEENMTQGTNFKMILQYHAPIIYQMYNKLVKR